MKGLLSVLRLCKIVLAMSFLGGYLVRSSLGLFWVVWNWERLLSQHRGVMGGDIPGYHPVMFHAWS